MVLFDRAIQFKYRNVIADIRSPKTAPKPERLEQAIQSYDRALRRLPCDVSMQNDRLFLLAEKSDDALNSSNVDAGAQALQKTQTALAEKLSCTPMDGKAWLDFALITTHLEGFAKRSLGAYKMSARVAPGESWLAEKRLIFALQFRPLLDEEARSFARKDIGVLAHAHPNRMHAVQEAAHVDTPQALEALFSAAPTK